VAFVKRLCGNRRIAICYQFDSGMIVADPALDMDRMDARAYADSLFDASMVAVKDGESPAWFDVRPMPHDLALAADAPTPLGKAEWIIRCCVRGVSGVSIVSEDGSSRELEAQFKPWGKLDILDDATVAALCGFGDNLVYPLMQQIRAVSEAGRGPLARPSSKPSGQTT
jgi:hypothetical protein